MMLAPEEQVFTYVIEDNERLSPATIHVADCVEDAAANNGGEELLNEESEETGADHGQEKVVDQEEALELEGLAVAHNLAATEDDNVVDDDEDGC